MLGANGGPILAEGDVADVVKRILNGPVAAAETLDLSRAHLSGRATGDEDLGFLGHVPGLEMMGGAADNRSLSGVRESGVLRSDFEGVGLPGFMPAVSLVQGDVRREKKRPPELWKGG